MRTIDRLYRYLKLRNITPYAFERNCGLSNGYLHKQALGKGSIGSDIIERILLKYPDINLPWLMNGEGAMTKTSSETSGMELEEEEKLYITTQIEMIAMLRNQIAVLEASLNDKNKIISLLEAGIKNE